MQKKKKRKILAYGIHGISSSFYRRPRSYSKYPAARLHGYSNQIL